MLVKLLIGAGLATWFGLGAWTLDGQAKLSAAVAELRGEITVLNATLIVVNERMEGTAALAARVEALERRRRWSAP